MPERRSHQEPNPRETFERRSLEIVRKRHAFVEWCLSFEDAVLSGSDDAVAAARERLADLKPSAETERNADEWIAMLTEMRASSARFAVDLDRLVQKNPDMVAYFDRFMKKNPARGSIIRGVALAENIIEKNGSVEGFVSIDQFSEHIPVWVVAAPQPKDFAAIRNVLKGNHPISPLDVPTAEFIHKATVPFSKETVPVIMTYGWDPDAARTDNRQRTVQHELQHFLNIFFFEEFRKTERVPSRVTNNRALAAERSRGDSLRQWVKDELLAYLREGASSKEFRKSLHGGAYDVIFDLAKDDDDHALRQLVETLETELHVIDTVFASPEARRVLIYQLVDIPLERIPDWLPVLARFYADKQR